MIDGLFDIIQIFVILFSVTSLVWTNAEMYKSSENGMVKHDLTETSLGVAPMNISFEINSTACIIPPNITIRYHDGSHACYADYKCTHQFLYSDSFNITVDPDPNAMMDILFPHETNYMLDVSPTDCKHMK